MKQVFFSSTVGNYLHSFMMLCLLAGACISSPVWPVELYRCTLNGRVEFRQTACTVGEQEKTQVEVQSHGMTPAEPGLRLERKQHKQVKNKAPIEAAWKPHEERCWKMEKKLEKVEQRLRGGYKASQYTDLHRKQNEYEEYLRYFCRS